VTDSTGGSSSASSASASASANASDVMELQDGTLVLGTLNWSANKEKNDGSFLSWAMVRYTARRLNHYNVKTSEVTKTVRNNETNDHVLTLLVVTNAGSIKPDNEAFNEAVLNCNFVRIVGNASNEQLVATELKWETVHSGGDRTVVMIVLESIYHGRNAAMKFVYHYT
jgi:hypothetical protein